MNDFDLSVYLVTDPGVGDKERLAALITQAIDGGVTMVQLRDKHASTRLLMDTAIALRGVLRAAGIPLIINDRVDVAHAVGADGVHLGQDDMPAPLARDFLGDDAIIGISIGSEDELDPRALAVADYAGIGPVWPTDSKMPPEPAIQVAGFERLRRRIDLPVVAIGGVTAERAAAVVEAGADGIAVISAITAADDAFAAASALSNAVLAARRTTTAD